ncbi:peptidoglycan DD-metalloendopeptidase family protein [Neobacillus sp. LXY-4]|uniref:peptidoglycan DD-metalloendopeptidase family protein n=1 Tax=Neobacillus sp. LXY-4 TaxID=3379826 RepID=UPI003EDFC1E4
MRSRADDVRKRIANRRKGREKQVEPLHSRLINTDEEERYGFDQLPSYEIGPGEGNHPLFRKEVFLFKLLAAACLFLGLAILFRNETSSLDSARNFVKQSLDKDFQFAAVSDWYEGKFGKPLALFPVPNGESNKAEEENGLHYALPASGKILEDFEESGQRVMIETAKDASVEAMGEGMVRFVGEKEGFGKTVVIQHADKSESWYGNLSDISVNLYDFIEKGKQVGTVTNSDSSEKGSFYFAIKKDENFIDPIQVIQFE